MDDIIFYSWGDLKKEPGIYNLVQNDVMTDLYFESKPDNIYIMTQNLYEPANEILWRDEIFVLINKSK